MLGLCYSTGTGREKFGIFFFDLFPIQNTTPTNHLQNSNKEDSVACSAVLVCEYHPIDVTYSVHTQNQKAVNKMLTAFWF